MPKDEMADLNKVYDEILGKGEPIEEQSSSGAGGDPAYMDEDYSDDAGDGDDPRDPSTQKDAEGQDDETAEQDDSGDSEGSDDTNESDDDFEDYGEEEIPDHLVTAGRNSGLSDDEIIQLAESQPKVLEALAKAQEQASQRARQTSQLDGATQQDGLGQSKKDADSKFKKLEIKFDDNDDEFSPAARKVIEQLAGQVNALTDTMAQHDQSFGDIQRQQQLEGTRRIDAFFDEVAKDVPLLGSAKSLSKEQVDARLYAYRIARGAQQTMEGLSDHEALTIGVNALKGQLTEQQVRTQIVSDLNKQKKRFTARPKGRRQVSPDSKHMTAEQRAMDAINRILDDPAY
jgi:hypothetical protein